MLAILESGRAIYVGRGHNNRHQTMTLKLRRRTRLARKAERWGR